jgi:hypothetical protein
MRLVNWWKSLALLAVPALVACSGSDDEETPAVPIEQIPDDTKVVELTAGERKGVCNWAKELAREELPAPGTKINCDGLQITMNAASCSVPDEDDAACTATLGEYEVCLPSLMARIGDDPCQLLELLSEESAVYFVETTPGCMGLGHCASAL